jgi:hypothetical protein
MFVKSKPFAQTSLNPVSANRTPEAFLDNHAQTMVVKAIRYVIDTEVWGPAASARLLYSQIFFRRPKSFVRPKPIVSLQEISHSNTTSSHAERRFRPLARLLLITERPALVDIRSKKPWVRFLFRLLG